MKYLQALFAGLLMVVSGCSSPRVQDYAQNKPEFDIRKYLNGEVEAWGMFVDSSGKADPTFHVALKGTWNGNNGVLQEHFDYSDGRTQDREWKLTFTDDHHFTGTAADVVGTATGEQYGNAAQFLYTLAVPTKDGATYNMSMNDWLYQMNDDTVINRNEMRKFGFKVGELIITFRKIK